MGIGNQRRFFFRDRVITFFDRGMSQRSEGAELVALVEAGNEGDIDPGFGDIAAVKSKAGVCFGPAFCQLSGVACRLGPIDAHAVDVLHGASRMDVTAE